ncbi:probable WRKY transcription factor 70 [Cajanus cajan]|uniref:probable WRKY transcription factor 70 n=1 Tax=Cajanus cajan TaxID=3821 RepID=UPI00098DC8C4|nr:probable WRKY transcription factor 70 [Cajanus cajan]
MENMISKKERLIMEELVKGQNAATQLKILLENPNPLGGTYLIPLSPEELLENVLSSFSQAISIINVFSFQPPPPAPAPAPAPHVLGSASYSMSGDCSVNWNRSQQGQSDERDSHSIGKGKGAPTSTTLSVTTEDSHLWKQYGQKLFPNSKFFWRYFRCIYKYDQGCKATKLVQGCEENPDLYRITYVGTHTCNANLPTRKGKGEPTWAAFSNTTEDGSLWRKYRHKILNSIFLRNDESLHEVSDHERQNRENDSLYSQFRGKHKITDSESSWPLLTSSSDRNTDTSLSNSHDYSAPS